MSVSLTSLPTSCCYVGQGLSLVNVQHRGAL